VKILNVLPNSKIHWNLKINLYWNALLESGLTSPVLPAPAHPFCRSPPPQPDHSACVPFAYSREYIFLSGLCFLPWRLVSPISSTRGPHVSCPSHSSPHHPSQSCQCLVALLLAAPIPKLRTSRCHPSPVTPPL
jgi:hypothetical protein